jgi:hypothetical protein
MRLEQDEDLWREVADLFAEMSAPWSCPPHASVATTPPRRSGQPLPVKPRRQRPRGWPPVQVWATQRSPP